LCGAGWIAGRIFPVKIPTVSKSCDFGAALLPPNGDGVRKFIQLAAAGAVKQIAAEIVQPTDQECAPPIHF
jgi:hypothetical protein